MQGYYYTVPFISTDKFDTSPSETSRIDIHLSKASVPSVRCSRRSSSDSASFSPPLVVVSKSKSFIVHIHAPLAAARHSPNKLVCRSLRSPCTNVRIVLKREGFYALESFTGQQYFNIDLILLKSHLLNLPTAALLDVVLVSPEEGGNVYLMYHNLSYMCLFCLNKS